MLKKKDENYESRGRTFQEKMCKMPTGLTENAPMR
jgi:hypothetical protein